MARLDALVIGGKRELLVAADEFLTLFLGILEMPEENVSVGHLEVVG